MTSPSDFQDYLQSLCTTYKLWWEENAFIDEIKDAWFEFVLDGKTKSNKSADEQRRTDEQRQEIPKPVLRLIEDYRHQKILIVGDPGAGKSTLLKRLLRDTAEKAQKDEQAPIPVLVELKDYKTTGDRVGIRGLILESLESHDPALDEDTLKKLLTGKRLLLLADGLNELSHEPAKVELKNLCRYQAIIATSRFANSWWDIDRKLEIQPLTPRQVKRFLEERLPNRDRAEIEKLGERVRDFGQTPLMVWMLYSIFQANKETPTTRGEAYRTFTALYVERAKTGLDLAESRFLLSKLAFNMMQSQKPDDPTHFSLDMTEVDAQNRLGSAKTLTQLLSLHLLQASGQPGNRKIRFCHQTLQEYYAAEALLEQLPTLENERLKQEFLNYLKWTEPVALMLALVADNALAVRVVEQALAVDWMLGARLAGEVKPDFQEQTVASLDQVVHQNNLPEWLRIELLGRTRSDIVFPEMLQALNNSNIEIARTAATVIGHTNNQTAIELLTTRLEEIDSRFFAQTSFGGSDRIGEIWTIHVEALSYVSPQRAVQFLRNKLDLINGSKHTILTMFTGASELLMKLDGEVLFPEMIEQLKDAETEHQKNHILNIIDSTDKYIFELFIPRLIQALEEEEISSIQVRLIKMIGKSANDLVTQTFIRLITQPKLRQEITKQLIQRNIQDFTYLEQLITHENLDIAYSAAYILGCFSKTSALPTLLNILKICNIPTEPNSSFEEFRQVQNRIMITKALGSINHEGSISCLLNVLRTDESEYVRREAAFSLSRLERKEAIPELLVALNAGSIDERTHGIRGLAKLGVKEPLWDMLRTKTTCWQTAAVELGNLGETEVLPYLRQALADLGFESSNEVIHLLAKFADLETCNWLVDALDNPELHQADQYFCNRIAFVLIECRPEIVQSCLPALKEIVARSYVRQIFWLIPAIQSRCGFYNYEIYQRTHKCASKNQDKNMKIDFAILTAIEIERLAVLKAFGIDEKADRVRNGSRTYWHKCLPLSNGKCYEVVVAQSLDMANVNAALLASDVLSYWQPSAVLMVGIAATAKPESKQNLGDIVIGKDVYYYELGKITAEGKLPEPKQIPVDATLLDRVQALPKENFPILAARPDNTNTRPQIDVGVIASGDNVIADAATRDAIAAVNRKTLAIEMEGYGVMEAARQQFTPIRCLVIRSLCDYGDSSKNDAWHSYAAAVAAGFTKYFLLDEPL